MNSFTMKTLAVTAALCAAFVAPTPAVAQEKIHHVYTNKTNVRAFIKDVERDSNTFRQTFERRYKGVFISNFRRTDHARKAVQDLDKALEMADRKAAFQKPQYVRDNIAKVLDCARAIDREFRDPDQILATMRGDWADLRASINGLAQLYELPDLDG